MIYYDVNTSKEITLLVTQGCLERQSSVSIDLPTLLEAMVTMLGNSAKGD
jgi:hypothetical protein